MFASHFRALTLALALASLASADPGIEALVAEGLTQAQREDHSNAVDAFDKAIRQSPAAATPYYWRGRSLFCLAKIKPAVADFDRFVELAPKMESQQWERGIALYYAGEFERGARQFELYQTYHDNDVENSTWRYLCVARSKGVDEAIKTMLPIKDDPRVPMMKIYDLYRGKLAPADVLAAVKADSPRAEELTARQFYAHLYLGLWYEAAGKTELAAKHVGEAERHKIGHYMWNVAQVHNQLRRDEQEKK